MKKIFIITFAISLAAVFACGPNGITQYVNSSTGLKMRNEPNLKSKTVTVIPYGAQVMSFEESGKTFKVGKISGKWTKIKWQNYAGWSYGGFLVKKKPASNIFPTSIRGYYYSANESDMESVEIKAKTFSYRNRVSGSEEKVKSVIKNQNIYTMTSKSGNKAIIIDMGNNKITLKLGKDYSNVFKRSIK